MNATVVLLYIVYAHQSVLYDSDTGNAVLLTTADGREASACLAQAGTANGYKAYLRTRQYVLYNDKVFELGGEIVVSATVEAAIRNVCKQTA